MIALDTNILLYAHAGSAPEGRTARAALDRAARDPGGWGVAFPVLAEFWSVATAPASPLRSSPEIAAAFLAQLENHGARIWRPAPDLAPRLRQAAAALAIRGRRIFDLQIALIAQDGGADELWTHDAAFVTVPGLALCDPLGGD